MTVYAVPSKSTDYITKGKRYAVLREHPPRGFEVKADNGFTVYCLWDGCNHLNGGIWERVEDDHMKIDQSHDHLFFRLSQGYTVLGQVMADGDFRPSPQGEMTQAARPTTLREKSKVVPHRVP